MTKQMYSKGNPQKKATFEDRFDRKYACWVKNNPRAWRKEKVRNRRKFRRLQKEWLDEE